MLKSSITTLPIFLILLMILSLAPPPASARRPTAELELHRLAARDAITLSIREVRETRKFVNGIPLLRSFRLTPQDPDLLLCVERLISDLTDAKSKLYRLKHLNPLFLRSDRESLKKTMRRSVELEEMCGKALGNVDGIVASMLMRKLDDVRMVVDDAVYHVAEIERETSDQP
ncbi:hypothetical protein Salat_1815600 [Sesamum alatum]|uniref:Pectinesterase inhibitor domain-containing protein n=1 Tax=Sesamum alatum TaxID=300844 RepID=A0AAE1Y254_9LAMI|nr:hypothetical protein Salat_1815600 [Sesamum alatum]